MANKKLPINAYFSAASATVAVLHAIDSIKYQHSASGFFEQIMAAAFTGGAVILGFKVINEMLTQRQPPAPTEPAARPSRDTSPAADL